MVKETGKEIKWAGNQGGKIAFLKLDGKLEKGNKMRNWDGRDNLPKIHVGYGKNKGLR